MLLTRLRDESGVAVVIVLMAVAIVTVMGSALFVSSIRDLDSSTSVQRSSSALAVAEAAVQHAIQRVKEVGPGPSLTALVSDYKGPEVGGQCTLESASAYWMNPDDPTTPENESMAPPPEDRRYTGCIEPTGRYAVYVTAVDPVDLLADPPKKEGVYLITAEGLDRRDNPVRPGLRTVEQHVSVKVLDVPFALFAKEGVNLGGTPTTLNESLYTLGDIKWRSKVTITGEDPYYGGPAAAHATGTIYEGNGVGGGANGPIHPPFANCDFPYDRDFPGNDWGIWPCDPTPEPASYEGSSHFNEDMLRELFDPSGPSEEVYGFLKDLAVSNGTYYTHSGASSFIVDATNVPNNSTTKFFVLYIDVVGTGDVKVKTGWGPDQNACENGNYDRSFGIIVVRSAGGADLEWENNEVWWGAAFVPEGEFRGTGAGSAWFVGTVYAETFGNTGNVRFKLNDCWVQHLPGPFFDVRRLRWHESDR